MKRRVYTVQGRNNYYGIDEQWEGFDTSIRMIDACKSRKAAEKYASNLNNAVSDFIADNRLDDACEGFSNYETASFALVIDNDKELLSTILGQVRGCLEDSRDDDPAVSVADYLERLYGYTNHIQFTHHDRNKTGIYESWLQAAAQRVDWLELARHYIRKEEEGVFKTP